MLVCFLGTVSADNVNVTQQQENIDVKGIVFGHIGDSYEWHITTWGNTKVVVPLPIIVRSQETGWHVFWSSALEESGEYKGFYIAQGGKYDGKIVEKNANGEEVRPLDISITKIVFALLLNCLILVGIILGVAHWYKKRTPESDSPRGFVGFMEMFIMMIYDDVIKSCVGKDYKRFAPYLLTVFFFIFLNNLMGLIPVFPAGANVTGNIAVTLVLALFTFFAVNLFGPKEYCLYKAICLNDSFVCEYDGGTLCYFGFNKFDIHYSQYGACNKWFDDCRIRLVRCVYEFVGVIGGIHSSVCVHHAVCRIYRFGKSGT